MRTTSQLIPSRLKAPMMPPVTELSSPMIAFWTVFESESRTTRSKGIELGQLTLAKKPKQQHQHEVHDDRAKQLLEEGKRQLKHVVEDLRGRHGPEHSRSQGFFSSVNFTSTVRASSLGRSVY